MDSALEGLRQQRNGKASAASKKYSAALADDTLATHTRVTILCNRARCNISLELYKRAMADALAILELDPGHLLARVLKGRILIALNKTADATAVLEEASQLFGDSDASAEAARLLKELQGSPPAPAPQRPASAPPKPAGGPVASASPAGAKTEMATGSASMANPAHNAAAKKSPGGQATLGGVGVSAPFLAACNSLAGTTGPLPNNMVQKYISMKDFTPSERVSLGHIMVNRGRLAEAVDYFDGVSKDLPSCSDLFVARGTALALLSRYEEAVNDFSKAIGINPGLADAYKRRAQVYAAKDRHAEAMRDLMKSLELNPSDMDALNQRGVLFHKTRNFRRGAHDLARVVASSPAVGTPYNFLGLCCNQLGENQDAVKYYTMALQMDPSMKEALVNRGQAYRDLADIPAAMKSWQAVESLDRRYSPMFHLRGLAKYQTGDVKGALKDFAYCIDKTESPHIDCYHMRGVCHHALGEVDEAIRWYTITLERDPSHVCVYQRALIKYASRMRDEHVDSYNVDAELGPDFKEGWAKRLPFISVMDAPVESAINKTLCSDSLPEDSASVASQALTLGRLCHYNTGGYLSNSRHQRALGLAILEVAQIAKRIWSMPRPKSTDEAATEGFGCTVLSGAMSSSREHRVPHVFNFRDLFDVAFKWRHLCDPNDPVWWVDNLTTKSFRDGFGSHTPILSGQLKVVRYYPNFPKAFGIMKELIEVQKNLSTESLKRVRAAQASPEGVAVLHDVMGEDFFVATPCIRSSTGGAMEGTRLTIQNHPPEGHEFSIRTACKPDRWAEYHEEMELQFTGLWDSMHEKFVSGGAVTDDELDRIVTLVFYWYNFMPLSRGSASIGVVVLMGLFLACGKQYKGELKKDFQLDWEAILAPNPESFMSLVKPWMYGNLHDTKVLDELPNVPELFPTIGHMYSVLNMDLE